jgi:hypothetical protein
MAPRSPAAVVLRLAGSGVEPATVDVRELAAIVDRLDKAIRVVAGLPESAATFHLLRITKGSAAYHLAGSPTAERAIADVVQCLVDGQTRNLPAAAREHLVSLTDIAERQGRRLTVAAGGKTADLTGDHRLEPPTPTLPQIARGTTTVFGVLVGVRLGRTDALLEVKPTQGQPRSLNVACDRVLAKLAAARIGDEIGLDGDAEWNLDTGELRTFRATRLADYVGRGSVESFIEELIALGPIATDVHEDDDDDADEVWSIGGPEHEVGA